MRDTLTSRAEITDLARKFDGEVVAIIGLGGTGAYLLDLVVRTPVTEVRGFDGDEFYVHNSFRAPGRLDAEELGKPKADVHRARYENFRHGVNIERKYIDLDSAAEIEGVATRAFNAEMVIEQAIGRRECPDVERDRFSEALFERLAEGADFEEFATDAPLSTIIKCICADIGLDVDWFETPRDHFGPLDLADIMALRYPDSAPSDETSGARAPNSS